MVLPKGTGGTDRSHKIGCCRWYVPFTRFSNVTRRVPGGQKPHPFRSCLISRNLVGSSSYGYFHGKKYITKWRDFGVAKRDTPIHSSGCLFKASQYAFTSPQSFQNAPRRAMQAEFASQWAAYFSFLNWKLPAFSERVSMLFDAFKTSRPCSWYTYLEPKWPLF